MFLWRIRRQWWAIVLYVQRNPIFSPDQNTHIWAVVKSYKHSFFNSNESAHEFAFVEALIIANSLTNPYSDIECVECPNSIAVKSTIEKALIWAIKISFGFTQ